MTLFPNLVEVATTTETPTVRMQRRMGRYIFCEPFAGSAAMTYFLLGGKPPISYVGSKSGYAGVISECLGLDDAPAGIVLGEPGPFAAVHACLGGAAGMSAEDVAGFLHGNALSMVKNGLAAGYSHVNGEGHHFTNNSGKHGYWTATTPEVSAARVEEVARGNASDVAKHIRSWKNEEPRALWERLKAKGWPSLLLPEGCGGRWLGPQSVEEVAGFCLTGEISFRVGDVESGFNAGDAYSRPKTATEHGQVTPRGPLTVAPRVDGAPTFPPLAVWQGTAETMQVPDDLTGFVCFADPPYKGDGTRKITGYPHGDCTRETVLRLAREWSERGATVAISECVSLRAELGEGWYDVDISHGRKGQKRTFGNTAEWLTMNREPKARPHRGQVGMWGG